MARRPQPPFVLGGGYPPKVGAQSPPLSKTVTQYTLTNGLFGEPTVQGLGDTLESALFPGVTLPVSELFRDLRAE